MVAERFALDTNILFYSIDAADERKHSIARSLTGLANPRNAPMLLQAFCELHNATSKRRPSLLPEAETFMAKSRRLFDIVPTAPDDLIAASTLHGNYPLQFFDALLLTIAARVGCTLFLSEDMQDNRTYGSITVRNPFLMSSTDLDALLDLSER
jgi:predicted nucleic acid-binding protein